MDFFLILMHFRYAVFKPNYRVEDLNDVKLVAKDNNYTLVYIHKILLHILSNPNNSIVDHSSTFPVLIPNLIPIFQRIQPMRNRQHRAIIKYPLLCFESCHYL